jgi:hypothetical protein
VIRSKSARQVLGALRYAVGTALAKEASTDLVGVPAQAITRGRSAVLLPPRTSHLPNPVDRDLIADGFRRLVTQEVLVEAASGRLFVAEPLAIDEQAAAMALKDAWDANAPQPEPRPGRYEVIGWIFNRSIHQPVGSRATALARALQLVQMRQQQIETVTLTSLAGLVRSIRVESAAGTNSSEVVALAREMLHAER